MKGRFPVLLTRAATFDQKAALFADARFAIGYDTAKRLFDSAYYESGQATDVDGAFALLAKQRSCFIVAGRRTDDGEFKTLETSRSRLTTRTCSRLFRNRNSEAI